MHRGFAGLLALFVLLPFAASVLDAFESHSKSEVSAASAFIVLQRKRFFEANMGYSFIQALSSAKGETAALLLADASQKLSAWSAAVVGAARMRGLQASFWAGCSQVNSNAEARKAIVPSADGLLPMLSYDSGRGALLVKYSGNDESISSLPCESKDFGVTLQGGGDYFDVIIPQGRYVLSGLSSEQDDSGLEQYDQD